MDKKIKTIFGHPQAKNKCKMREKIIQMEENHQILQENSTELKDMSFKTETFNKHPAQWVQINPPKGKTLKSEHWGERPSENRGGGEKNGSHRRPRNEEGFKLLTNNTRNHMIKEQCLQNHEKKII